MTKPVLSSNSWIVVVGDSRLDPSGDVGPGTTGTVIAQLRGISNYLSAVTTGNVYNFAHDSFTTANMLGQFTAGYFGANTSGAPVIFICWGGVNDLAASVSPTDIAANLKSMWYQARQLGYHVVAFTSGLSGGQTTEQMALDALIMSDPTLYDVLIRPESVLPIRPSADTGHVWYIDGVHPTAQGNLKLAQAIDAALDP